MSVWRMELDTSFKSEDDAVAFLNLLQEVKDKLFPGTGSEQISIISNCRYHECFHDEIPPKQCGNYIYYDLKDATKKEVKNKAGQKIEASTLLDKE